MSNQDDKTQLALMLAMSQVPPPTEEDKAALKMPADMPLDVLWNEQIAMRARDILFKTAPASPMYKSVNVMAMADDPDNKGAKAIWTTIESFELNPNSQRVKIQFRGAPTQKAADGREHGFTERLDSKYDANGRLVARAARELVGHKVIAYIEMQTMTDGSGNKVRVVKHLIDRGPATQADFEPRK